MGTSAGVWELTGACWARFREHEGTEVAAALAFRLAAAVFPYLIFLAGVAGVVVQQIGGDEPAREAVDRLDAIVSADAADFLERELRRTLGAPSAIAIGGGMIASLWTGLFGGISVVRHLNHVWKLDETRAWWQVAVTALALPAAASIAVLVALGVMALGTLNPEDTSEALGLGEGAGIAFRLACWPIALALLMLTAAFFYWVAPNRAMSFHWASVGGAVFGLLWTAASGCLLLYVANASSFSATYGTLAGVVALLAWFYLTALAFVIGGVIEAEMEARAGG